MIIVFVIDTSPSMGLPVSGDAGSGMSRLDVAKMAVEEFVRQWRKRQTQHVRLLQEIPAAQQRSLLNVGLGGSGGSSSSSGTAATGGGGVTSPNAAAAATGGGVGSGSGGTLPDSLLLLSTAVPQHAGDADITSSCAAGGRLLVSFAGSSAATTFDGKQQQQQQNPPADSSASLETAAGHQQQEMLEAFQKELKGLQCYNKWEPGQGRPFPDDAGGASGLNAALSAGLQLLSRYRLHNRWTENFGMGRFTSTASMTPTAAGNPAMAALQPACLVVLTDGACLRQSPKVGGGSLQLQYGSQPLREMYNEPFRWDQRIFCLGIGGGSNNKSSGESSSSSITSSQFLHPQLRALCEVTGGSHWLINKAAGNQLSSVAESILKRLCPPLVRELPVPDPLYLRMNNTASNAEVFPTTNTTVVKMNPGLACYIHGGPAVNLQCIEQDDLVQGGGSSSPKSLRAMLLYTASTSTTVSVETASVLSPPLWCIPEAYFPGKKLDSLPPRKAQPLLLFSKYPGNLGSKSFEPLQVIKMLHRLDQLTIANRKVTLGLMQPQQPQPKCLHRDTYICEWLSPEGGKPVQVSIATPSRQEYFPVMVPGAGRPTLSDEGDNFLNIGILHVPANGSSTLAASANASRLATLTLLPPEPHILLPLLVRAAEAEHRVLKKLEAKGNKSVPAKINVPLDEHWRAEFRAYMFRVPPYYQYALRRALRPVLPAGTANVLPMDSPETILYQCFSKVCLQKIRQGEQVARDNSERLERQEMSLRRRGGLLEGSLRSEENKTPNLRYGQFDARASVDSYLAALRNMPAPWRVRAGGASSSASTPSAQQAQKKEESGQEAHSETAPMPRSCLDVLGDLPASCLMAYYESRRRWLFGGTGLSTRGLHVAGVSNDGSNSQRCDTKPSEQEECLLSLAGVGVSMINQTSTTKMGDYRERLLFSRAPIVGTGSNDYAGVSTTTAIDGSPKWSVDDDALPATFFNPLTGEFTDNVQARVRSRLMVNFGNPYKEKRADSIVPEKFLSQSPAAQRGQLDSEDSLGPRTPPGSPPHESWDSVEEGEAIFERKSPTRTSPKREDPPDDFSSSSLAPPAKRQRSNSMDDGKESPKSATASDKPPPPKRPSVTRQPKPPPPKPSSGPPPPKPPPKPAGSAPPPPKPGGAGPKPPDTAANAPPPPPKPSSGAAAAVAPPPKPPAPAGKAVKRPSSVAPPPPPLSRHTSSGGVRPPAPPKPPPKPPAPGAGAGPPGGGARPPAPDMKKRRASSISVPPPPPPAAAIATTSSSSSTAPAPAPAPATTTNTNTSATTTPTPQDLQRPDVKPQVDLPPGWMCVWSKSQKRWYFFNTTNNKSVWQWPPPK